MTRIGLTDRWGRLRSLWIAIAALSLVLGFAVTSSAAADGIPLNTGDVLAAVGSGVVKHFDSSGNLLDTLNTTSGAQYTAGMCFDAAGNVFVTSFDTNQLSEFDKSGNLVTASFGSGYNAHPESCSVDQAGHIFVGQADGSRQILEFDANGNLINSFSPATEDRGTDWIDLSSDQCTMQYTSEGSSIKQFNVCTNTQLADFATGLVGPCYEHRQLSDGSVLVACSTLVYHLNSSGVVIKAYPEPTDCTNGCGDALFALNIDPDGTSFWTGDLSTGDIWRIDIASGQELTHFNAAINTALGGLAIVGERTAALDPPITATGTSVSATEGSSFSGTVATFSDSDSAAQPGDYSATINWGDGTTTTGTISGSPSQFSVAGSHTYSEEGSQTITVTITDTDNTSNTATATSKATIADAALHASGGAPSRSGKTITGTAATFTDSDPGGTVSDYSASINWGDGSTGGGTVSAGNGHFVVSGSHTYAKAGTYTVTTTIKDAGGSTATASVSVTIPKTSVKAASVSAKLSSVPAACVSNAFTARVVGTRIRSVRFTLDGRRLTTTRVRYGRQYSARISVAPGHHSLTVKIRFHRGSAVSSRTFHRTVVGCAAAVPALPKFTG